MKTGMNDVLSNFLLHVKKYERRSYTFKIISLHIRWKNVNSLKVGTMMKSFQLDSKHSGKRNVKTNHSNVINTAINLEAAVAGEEVPLERY